MPFLRAFPALRNRLCLAVALLALSAPALAGDLRLGANVLVSFASTETGRKILTTRDEFVLALSPFDRAARMKTDRQVSEKEFLEFVGRNIMAWQPDETNKIAGLVQHAGEKLAAWNLPFPAAIVFIKTLGQEEGNASYTRQNAVILPEKDVHSSGLEETVIHELFHILSRHNPDLRRKLYRIIGFNLTDPIDFPEELKQRKITNPDGVENCWFINVTNQGGALPVMPILYASADHYDPGKGGEFFDYMVFKFLVLKKSGRSWAPSFADGHPQLLGLRNVKGYLEQVGNNTGYIIHPDEILADNFVFLVNGRVNLPTPRIVADMEKVLRQH
jgi:hypothetical protein